MPRKVKDLLRDLERAGFVNRGGKGSHRNYKHLLSGIGITISGSRSEDVKAYQEKAVKQAIEGSLK
jgi:predicted RNA binding protein YcfA (HicA-like mRNA interferase family)